MEKIEKEQSIILQVEDDTSTVKLVAPKKDNELVRKIERLLVDQVIGVRVVKTEMYCLLKMFLCQMYL